MIIADSNKPIEILVVEDNPGDVELIRESFEGSSWEPHFHIATDGEEALAFLQRKERYHDAPQPDLIFLDLNLPKKTAGRCYGSSSQTGSSRQFRSLC